MRAVSRLSPWFEAFVVLNAPDLGIPLAALARSKMLH